MADKELSQFAQYGLFLLPVPSTIRNTQNDFKNWFNQIMQKCQITSSKDNESLNITDIVIIDVPAYDPSLIIASAMMNQRKTPSKELRSLQTLFFTRLANIFQSVILHKISQLD